jgi:UDP-N-acetyl-D-glucosamine/UDP-N-acetyl-D-galactosamine dehydrogenase
MSKLNNKKSIKKNHKIAIIGVGYVGLPLVIEFSKIFNVVGFDLNKDRIRDLKNSIDKNLEFTAGQLNKIPNLRFSHSQKDIKDCNIYIISIPTPIDNFKKPDLTNLKKSSELIGSLLKNQDIVIYESTVYPGLTEEFCAPLLEKASGLIFNKNFFCGYSPERINPGDKKHTLVNVKKITSGSTPKTAEIVDQLYKKIVIAGTFKAKSIKVAEAAKVIENTQRDVNIALINELAIIFRKLNIDTNSVLDAASTKWNFLPFKPGLVGGHCIGVDPYYLSYKAQEIGYNPEMILAGRRLNDSMGYYIRDEIIKLLIKKRIDIFKSNVLIMGITFKENCPDIRNSRVTDLVKGFEEYDMNVDVYDPWVDKDTTWNELGIRVIDKPIKRKYDVLVLAVAHEEFKNLPFQYIKSLVKKKNIIFDIKNILVNQKVDGRL